MALTRNRARELAGVIQAADAEADGVDAGEVLVRLDRRDLSDLAKAMDAYAGGYGGLTPRMVEALQIIQELAGRDGSPPSFRALAREMETGLSNVYRVVGLLIERGYLEMPAHRPISMRIVRRVPMPDFTTPEFSLAQARAAS